MDFLTRAAVDVNNWQSVSFKARQRRWAKFAACFPDIGSMRVLDLGGTPNYWQSAPCRPKSVTTVNLIEYDSNDTVTAVQGDACHPPVEVLTDDYDLVVSNSLLEHVGGHAQRQRLADVVRTAAPRYWVQTPYRYFPVEPHWLFPGLQFLPFALRVWVTQHWRFGHRHTGERGQAIDSVHEVELLSITQMGSYFPDSTVWLERWAGLPKSMVAIKT